MALTLKDIGFEGDECLEASELALCFEGQNLATSVQAWVSISVSKIVQAHKNPHQILTINHQRISEIVNRHYQQVQLAADRQPRSTMDERSPATIQFSGDNRVRIVQAELLAA